MGVARFEEAFELRPVVFVTGHQHLYTFPHDVEGVLVALQLAHFYFEMHIN